MKRDDDVPDPLTAGFTLLSVSCLVGFFFLPALVARLLDGSFPLPAELLAAWERDPAREAAFAERIRQGAWLFGVGLTLTIALIWAGVRDRLREKHLIWVVVAAAFVLRVSGLGREPNGDEARTWLEFIEPGPIAALTYYPAPNNHVLFSLMSSISYALFGSRLLVMSCWIAVSSLGSWGLWRVLKNLGEPPPVCAMAALLYASWPLAVELGIQLRGYGGMAALVPFVLDAYCTARKTGLSRSWLLFGLLAAAACGLHLFSVFLIAALGLHALARPPRGREARSRTQALYGLAVFGVALLTLHAWVLPQMWHYVWRQSGAASYQGLTLSSLLGLVGPGTALRIVAAVGLVLGVVACGYRRRFDVLYFGLAPPALALGVVGVGGLFFFERFLLFAVPGLIMLLALGIAWPLQLAQEQESRRAVVVSAGAVSVALCSLLMILTWRPLPALYVASGVPRKMTKEVRRRKPDVILVAGRFHPLVRFYLPEAAQLRRPEQLHDAPDRHVVIASARDPKWENAFSEAAAKLDRSYSQAWAADPRPGAQNTALRRAVLLVPD